MKGGGEGEGLMPRSIGTDRGVEMDQLAMARQLGPSWALGLKSFLAKAKGSLDEVIGVARGGGLR